MQLVTLLLSIFIKIKILKKNDTLLHILFNTYLLYQELNCLYNINQTLARYEHIRRMQ